MVKSVDTADLKSAARFIAACRFESGSGHHTRLHKPRARYADEKGLTLEVASNGGRRWFWKYGFSGKEKRLALGHDTEPGSKAVKLGLKDARDEMTKARSVLKTGVDPVQRRKADTAAKAVSAATTFEAVALE